MGAGQQRNAVQKSMIALWSPYWWDLASGAGYWL
jgi:hypothetical protein